MSIYQGHDPDCPMLVNFDKVNQDEWRKQLEHFKALMIHQIERNSHKGMCQAWLQNNLEQYLIELQMNLAELRIALAYGQDVGDKAADVAVDAFIVWDLFTNSPRFHGIPENQRFDGE